MGLLAVWWGFISGLVWVWYNLRRVWDEKVKYTIIIIQKLFHFGFVMGLCSYSNICLVVVLYGLGGDSDINFHHYTSLFQFWAWEVFV